MIWVEAQSGGDGSCRGRSESNRPFASRSASGGSSGGPKIQDWWVTGVSGLPLLALDADAQPP
ncbi:MAG TPA: hypothetical protein VM844_06590 [Miltoncostaeaceae bacterium]|nr:hypothetical protein [Miltoncostaeaceae bacterium]